MKKYTILLFLTLSLLASIPNKINISEVKQLISSSNPKLKNNISNLQIAPFNKSIVSFESFTKKRRISLKRLFLYNTSNNRLLEVESKNYSTKSSKRSKMLPKNYGLSWHPTKGIFVFSGNGYMGRSHLFIVKIVDTGFMNTFALKGYHIGLDKETKIFCNEPSFTSDGESLFFARKIYKKKGNTHYKICKIENISSSLENKSKGAARFENYPFSIYAEDNYDLREPKCAPPGDEDRNLIAYLKLTNQRTRGQKNFYQKYDIVISDINNNQKQTTIKLDGFRAYSYFWGINGEYLYYQKSRALIKTPQSWVDKKLNIIDLAFAKIITHNNKILNLIQSNQKKDVLIRDVKSGFENVSLLDNERLFISKFVVKKGWQIFLVDIPKWRKREPLYATKLNIQGSSISPKYVDGKLIFLNQKGKLNSLFEINLKIELGAQKEMLAKEKEMNEKVKTQKAGIMNLKKDITNIEVEISHFQKIKDGEILKIETKQKIISKKLSEKDALSNKIVKLKIDKNNLLDQEARLDNLTKDKGDLSLKLETINNALKSGKKEHTNLSGDLNILVADLADKKNQLNTLKSDLEKVVTQKNEKEVALAKEKAEEEALLKEEEDAQAEEEGVLLGNERIDLGNSSTDDTSGDDYIDDYSDEYDDENSDSSDDTEVKTRP